ncbi:MAG: CapA family protein [Clostridia bacterium]|nr:CapA family protein [Clostridia bacterium]
MEKSNTTKSKIIAVIISTVAALLAVALVLSCILNPPRTNTANGSPISDNSSTVNSDFVSSVLTPVISEDTNSSSEESPTSSVESDVSREEPSSSSEKDTSSNTKPQQSKPTDLDSIKPLKSGHKVAKDSKEFNITLSFTGDMILATNENSYYSGSFAEYAKEKDPDYFLEKVRPIFEADDFTIVNLENVLTDRKLSPVYKDYSPAFWFKAPASNIKILSGSSIEGTLIANNHIKDYGTEGYKDTIAAIKGAGMLYGDESKIMYFEKGGYVISVICAGLWGEWQANNIINLMKTAKKHSHYQVVMFHGGTEKIHAPEEWKRRAARKLVDNGADLVVGGHPHVLQPREVYKGVEIVYSIGNFCYGGHRQPENRTVIYQMSLTIDKNLKLKSSESNIIPCYVYTEKLNNFQPAIVKDETIKKRILDFMDGKISSPV